MTDAQAASFARTDRRAAEFILASRLHTLPVRPGDLIRQHKWGLVSYAELSRRLGTDPAQIAGAAASRDGYTVYNGKNFCIAFNGAVEYRGRIAFTLMHEVGHIVLGHFRSKGSSRLLFADDPALEAQASRFAGDVLAPFAVLDACGYRTEGAVRGACGLTREAALHRLSELRGWRPGPLDAEILRAFAEYVRFVPRGPRVSVGRGSLCPLPPR